MMSSDENPLPNWYAIHEKQTEALQVLLGYETITNNLRELVKIAKTDVSDNKVSPARLSTINAEIDIVDRDITEFISRITELSKPHTESMKNRNLVTEVELPTYLQAYIEIEDIHKQLIDVMTDRGANLVMYASELTQVA